MRRALAVLVAVWVALVPAGVFAHPLGNLTVNRYARVEVGPGHVWVRYVVDMAEVPTFQERGRLEEGIEAYREGKAAELARGLRLSVDGRAVGLRVESAEMEMPAGQAGLPTLRLGVWLSAPVSGSSLRLEDTNFAGRVGWREMVVRGVDGVRVEWASVPGEDVSDGLRAYPEDGKLLDVGVAEARLVVAGAGAAGERSAAGSASAATPAWARAGAGELPIEGVPAGVALVLALAWGAWHALTPGHGKTVVAAYLVGSRGTARHAVYLGLTVTLTHTLGIYALGLATLFAAAYVVPERLYPWLSLGSGAAVVGVGGWMLRERWRAARHAEAHARGLAHEHGHHEHEHEAHGHDHGRGGHSHAPPERLTARGLVALGVAGGLLPCPSALVLMLGAIALGQVALGLLLVVAFSVGLAAVLTAIGVALVYARGLVERAPRLRVPALRWAPVASALAVTAVGAAMSAQALAQLRV